VPRTSPPDRLRTIVDAATGVFLDKGYKRTLMTDVAAALELSPGTLYNHVESKEALFHLCLLPDVELPKTPPPFRTPPMSETVAGLRKDLRTSTSLPRLRRALRDPAPDATQELREVLLEFYEKVHRRHRVVALIERSAHDIPATGEVEIEPPTCSRRTCDSDPTTVVSPRSRIPTRPRTCCARA
jgi:AcrR family transcriptional regulator